MRLGDIARNVLILGFVGGVAAVGCTGSDPEAATGASSGGPNADGGLINGVGVNRKAGERCSPADTCIGSFCIDGFCCSSDCTDTCAACDVPGKEGTCTPITGRPHGQRACLGDADGTCAGSCNGTVTATCDYPTTSCGAAPSCSAGVGVPAGTCAKGLCKQPQEICADKLCSGSACATVAQIATGSGFACALLSDGTVRCWGGNHWGQLGQGGSDTADRAVPTVVPGLTNVRSIAAGTGHVCASMDEGNQKGVLKCWGRNLGHQLGRGEASSSTDSGPHPTPAPVCASGSAGTCVPLTGVAKVAAGHEATCAIVGTGVKCWGDPVYGELGNGSITAPANANPVAVCDPLGCASGPLGQSNGGIVDIAMGVYHVCAIDGSGGTLCWGNNNSGQSGTANPGNYNVIPQTINAAIGGQVAKRIATSSYGACAIISDGNDASNLVRCWGYGVDGERGNSTSGNNAYGPAPVTVCSSNGCGTNLTGATAISTAGGSSGTAAMCAVVNGAVWCWGDNASGELASGTVSASPVTFAQKSLVTSGATGLNTGFEGNGCAIVNAGGTLRCWGTNDTGEIGDGTTTVGAPQPTPTAQKW